MALVPPLPSDSSLAVRGVEFAVRKPAAAVPELPTRAPAAGTPPPPQAARAGAAGDPAAVLAPDLARLLETIDLVAGGSRAEVDWPQPSGHPRGQALAGTPGQALGLLREALADSPLFAIRRLAERWFPAAAARIDARDGRPTAAVTADERWLRASAADPHTEPARMAERPDASRPSGPADPAPLPADRPAPRDLAQAAALVIGGRLQWQGELTPGVQARLVREDHWHPEPEGDGGGLQAGTRLTLVVDLPHLGPVTLQAIDTPGGASIDLFAEPLAAARLEADLGRLQDRMRRLRGGASVKIRPTEPGRRR